MVLTKKRKKAANPSLHKQTQTDLWMEAK